MPDESSAEYLEDAANAILKAYFTLVSKRKDGEYSQQQVDEMYRFRSEWVKFTFTDNRFYQGGVQLGVPAESFMLHMLPPSVKF
jgi:coproporphyrinogen III oxidase